MPLDTGSARLDRCGDSLRPPGGRTHHDCRPGPPGRPVTLGDCRSDPSVDDLGVLRGLRADVDPVAVGYPIMDFVRLRYPTGNYKPLHDVLDTTPDVLEAHHVTDDDCFILKVLARSMVDLERVTGKLATLGSVTTSVVYSSPLQRRSITRGS